LEAIHMATLLDLQEASEPGMPRGIIRNVIDTSPILGQFQFETEASLRFQYSVEGNLPDPAFRGSNEAYSTSEGDFDLNTLQLKMFGSRFTADRKHQRVPTFDRTQWAAKQTEMHSRAISLDWKKNIFKGNVGVNPKAHNGLEVLVEDLASSQKIDFAGGDLTTAIAVTVNKIDEAIDESETVPDFIACNRQHLRDLNTITRTGTNDVIAEKFKMSIITVNGVRKRVGMWDDIVPMIPVDKDSDGAEILAFDEDATGTPGASGALSSMYFVSNMNGAGFTLVGDMMVPEITTFDDDAGFRVILDWALAVAIQHPRSVTRLYNIAT